MLFIVCDTDAGVGAYPPPAAAALALLAVVLLLIGASPTVLFLGACCSLAVVSTLELSLPLLSSKAGMCVCLCGCGKRYA